MELVSPSVKLISGSHFYHSVLLLDKAIETCYGKIIIDNERKKERIKNTIQRGHESVIEHASVTFEIVTDRAVTHELVRHRIGVSYSQESQRFCSQGEHLKFCRPHWLDTKIYPDGLYNSNYTYEMSAGKETRAWFKCMDDIESYYFYLLKKGMIQQDARGVLPNATATKIIVSMNFRSLRHFFKLRRSKRAHPDMQIIANKMFDLVCEKYPYAFEDLKEDSEIEKTRKMIKEAVKTVNEREERKKELEQWIPQIKSLSSIEAYRIIIEYYFWDKPFIPNDIYEKAMELGVKPYSSNIISYWKTEGLIKHVARGAYEANRNFKDKRKFGRKKRNKI